MKRTVVLLLAGTWCATAVAQRTNIPATTVQLPTFGVSIDADGVLRKSTLGNPAELAAKRRRAMLQANPGASHFATSNLRKISLSRMEQEILKLQAAGQTPDDVMLHLAGLQRVEYVFIDPDEQDVMLAGPAGGWVTDAAGRAIGAESGHPVILLEDLLVALRTFQTAPGKLPWIACSIDPTTDGMHRFVEFQRTIPRSVPHAARDTMARQIAAGSEESLGLATVNVYGIASDTHMASVLVEADYRMKLIGLGLEPPPVRMATFMNQMRRAPKQMQRWWFMPDDRRLRATPDNLAVQFVGAGVKLSTEKVALVALGKLQQLQSSPSAASRRYADSFTEKYAQIAHVSPVYWQLRTMIDLLVAAAWLQAVDAAQHLSHPPLSLIDDSVMGVHQWPVPRWAACVANAVWKGNVLLAPVGGGISINVAHALLPSNVATAPSFDDVREQSMPDGHNWWWD